MCRKHNNIINLLSCITFNCANTSVSPNIHFVANYLKKKNNGTLLIKNMELVQDSPILYR